MREDESFSLGGEGIKIHSYHQCLGEERGLSVGSLVLKHLLPQGEQWQKTLIVTSTLVAISNSYLTLAR